MDDSLEYFDSNTKTSAFEENDSFFKFNECANTKSEYFLRNQVVPKAKTNFEQLNIYDFTHDHRGKAIIINNRDFNEDTGLTSRSGTDKDAKNIYECFTKLGFESFVCENLTVKQIMHLTETISQEDFSRSDCLVFVIMSHGEDGLLWGVDATFKLEHLTYHFRGDICPSLAGKPKLFFIQACRGMKLDNGIVYEHTDADFDEIDARVFRKIPVESDFLIAFAVVEGYYCWRNCEDGSWFIQSLCRALDEFAPTLDMLRVLTRVNGMVCEYESNTHDPDWHRKKQCPSIVSMLTRDLYFFHPSFSPNKNGDVVNSNGGGSGDVKCTFSKRYTTTTHKVTTHYLPIMTQQDSGVEDKDNLSSNGHI